MRRDDKLQPARYCRQLLVSWKVVDGVPHGLLTIVIQLGREREEYRLQQVPKKFYHQLLSMPEPEQLMNQLLRMYLG